MMYTKEELERFDEILDGGFTRVVVVRHENGMKCLFKVPDGVKLKPDDMVICETFKGEQRAVCVTHALLCGKYALDAWITVMGATLPLKNIIGKYTIERF